MNVTQRRQKAVKAATNDQLAAWHKSLAAEIEAAKNPLVRASLKAQQLMVHNEQMTRAVAMGRI